jgi:HSP20 family molecular chaperone IbpA
MSTKQNKELNDIWENFFNGDLYPKNNYKVKSNENGSNTIIINAVGHRKLDIKIDVVDNALYISSPLLKKDTSLAFVKKLDYKFELGNTFTSEGITAKTIDGILYVTVQKKQEKEKITKQIVIE